MKLATQTKPTISTRNHLETIVHFQIGYNLLNDCQNEKEHLTRQYSDFFVPCTQPLSLRHHFDNLMFFANVLDSSLFAIYFRCTPQIDAIPADRHLIKSQSKKNPLNVLNFAQRNFKLFVFIFQYGARVF